tara:strand:- start:505 stop:1587 length:1083 start_codon:yes stop_codon:yes gene_type:complete
MAISPDVVATALQDLAPGYSELFTQYHPIMDRVVKRGNMDRGSLKGPYREFVVVAGGPGSVTQITTGSEVITGGRSQQASRGNAYAPRLVYAFDVPGKDLAEANGENDLAKIIKRYPELALSDFHERIAAQIAAGNGTGVGGFMTLNGDAQYTSNGTREGILDFANAAGQTQSVLGLTKQGGAGGVTGWYNQYGQISSFATDGRSTMRKAYYAASRQGAMASGPVDLLLGDETSYLNYIDDLDDQVRVMKVEGDKAPKALRQGIPFLEADFFLEEAIDISSGQFTSGGSNNGVIYMLKTDTWHMFTLGHDSNMETKGDFSIRGPFRIPEQDLFRYEYVLNMGMYCDQMRANAVVTGGATP